MQQYARESIPRYLDSSCYKVVCGGVEVFSEPLRYQCRHTCYTGGGVVDKIVMRAAA